MSRSFYLSVLLLFFTLPFFQAHAQLGTAPQEFMGHWNGGGQISLSNGKIQTVHCSGNYTSESPGMQQRIRCSGKEGEKAFVFQTVSKLQFQGNQIRGTFQILESAATGTLNGTATKNSLSMEAASPGFNSSIRVALPSRCRQQIHITPKANNDIRSVTINLNKSRCSK